VNAELFAARRWCIRSARVHSGHCADQRRGLRRRLTGVSKSLLSRHLPYVCRSRIFYSSPLGGVRRRIISAKKCRRSDRSRLRAESSCQKMKSQRMVSGRDCDFAASNCLPQVRWAARGTISRAPFSIEESVVNSGSYGWLRSRRGETIFCATLAGLDGSRSHLPP
jgi:hypothetical protein